MGKQSREAKKRRREALRRLNGNPQPESSNTHGLSERARERSANHPIFATPILYSDLTGSRPTQDEVDALLSRFKRRPTFFMLAMLNALLSFYEKDIDQMNYMQGFLLTNLIDDELFERTKRRYGPHRMEERPLFHRQQLLTMMRRVLAVASNNGGLDPNPNDAKDVRYMLGRVATMVSDLLSPDEQSEKLKARTGDGDRERIHDELFAQLLPSFELTNPPDAPYSVIRNSEYFKIFERGAGDFTFADGQGLAERFRSLAGLELRRYLMLVYCIYGYYEVESKSRDNLINDPSRFNISKDTTFAKMDVTQAEIDALFRLTASDIDELAEASRNAIAPSTLLPYYGFAEFRRSPLVYTNKTKRIATVIDMGFLIEKISTGVYHTILRSLEGEDKAQQQDRKKFLRRYWGDVFEIYVNDRLGGALPSRRCEFYRSPVYDQPKLKKGEETFDAVIDYGDALVVMEHKGKYLKLEAKYSEQREVLIADLDGRFGYGVRQLADNIEVVFNSAEEKRGEFSERDREGKVTKSFTREDAKRVRMIYPVIVAQDFSLRIGFANRWLRNLFESEIRKRDVDQQLIRPLSLLTVEDLEKILPYMNDLSFIDILEEYTKEHEPLYSFEYIFRELCAQKGIPRRRDKWFEKRLEELHEDIKSMFVVMD